VSKTAEPRATSPYVDAKDVAAELLVTLPTLKRMAQHGEYPELLFVSRGNYRVLRSDHEAWKQGRTTSAIMARAELQLERAKAALQGKA
jgi:hypothetical protein